MALWRRRRSQCNGCAGGGIPKINQPPLQLAGRIWQAATRWRFGLYGYCCSQCLRRWRWARQHLPRRVRPAVRSARPTNRFRGRKQSNPDTNVRIVRVPGRSCLLTRRSMEFAWTVAGIMGPDVMSGLRRSGAVAKAWREQPSGSGSMFQQQSDNRMATDVPPYAAGFRKYPVNRALSKFGNGRSPPTV